MRAIGDCCVHSRTVSLRTGLKISPRTIEGDSRHHPHSVFHIKISSPLVEAPFEDLIRLASAITKRVPLQMDTTAPILFRFLAHTIASQ